MDETKINLPSEDLPSELNKNSGTDRTKQFLKKLELQHKLLKRMIDADIAGLTSGPEENNQGDVTHPDTPPLEK